MVGLGVPRVVAAGLVALALEVSPVVPASAQGNPGNSADNFANPHPSMPWVVNGATRVDYGQVIRYFEVSAQQVMLALPVPLPDGVPPRTEYQAQTIPGYYVTETTTGFWYPERWTLWQLNVGVFQWARVPGEFRRKQPAP